MNALSTAVFDAFIMLFCLSFSLVMLVPPLVQEAHTGFFFQGKVLIWLNLKKI